MVSSIKTDVNLRVFAHPNERGGSSYIVGYSANGLSPRLDWFVDRRVDAAASVPVLTL